MNKKVYSVLLILILLFLIQYNELENKRKKFIKLQYNLEYNNTKIKEVDEENKKLKTDINSLENNLKNKIEEKGIWIETKKKIEKALS